jgi:hypothetical protein
LISAFATKASTISGKPAPHPRLSNILKLFLTLVFTCGYQIAHAEDNAFMGGRSGFSAAGTTGASTTATVNKFEYERKLSDLTTLIVGFGDIKYRAIIATAARQYQEDGSGTSVFMDLNFYPDKKTMYGFYVGPGVGITPLANHWADNRSGVRTSGGSTANVLDIHGKLGWKFHADRLIIDPNVRLGYFLNSPQSGADNLGLYLLVGINVGMMF